MIKEAIAKLMNKENLSYEEARQVMDEIMDGKVSPTLISSYLTALSMKGETTDEISGSAYAMRAHATKVQMCIRDSLRSAPQYVHPGHQP